MSKKKKHKKKHCRQVLQGLHQLKNMDDVILKHAEAMLKAEGGKIYGLDTFAVGALKRTMALTNGFISLIKERNLVAARALLRMHLDTVMRFFAAWLVENPHKFANDILSGKRINQLKDRNGNRLTDRYLVEELGKQYKWMPEVYTRTSSYIHLSGNHFFSAIQDFNDQDRSCQVVIGAEDSGYPDFSYIEAVDCFKQITDVFIRYMKGWITTKNNPELVEKVKNS
jgi:hypothetical protein